MTCLIYLLEYCSMMTAQILNEYQKVKILERVRKLISIEIVKSTDWTKDKMLYEIDCEFYDLWYQLTNRLSYLVKK